MSGEEWERLIVRLRSFGHGVAADALEAERNARLAAESFREECERQYQTAIAARIAAEVDRDRLREALGAAAEEAHVWGPDHLRTSFAACSYYPCRERRAALTGAKE